MSGSVNRVTIVGNLGQDPEIRYTTAGKAVATLSVATSDRWKDASGEQQERTEWHRVVFWERTAEICAQYLAKGSKVYVEGSLRTRKYVDREGVERWKTEIHGLQLVMLGDAKGGQEQQPRGQSRPQREPQGASWPGKDQSPPDDFDDDIPF